MAETSVCSSFGMFGENCPSLFGKEDNEGQRNRTNTGSKLCRDVEALSDTVGNATDPSQGSS